MFLARTLSHLILKCHEKAKLLHFLSGNKLWHRMFVTYSVAKGPEVSIIWKAYRESNEKYIQKNHQKSDKKSLKCYFWPYKNDS